MANKKGHKANRIPIEFVDDDHQSTTSEPDSDAPHLDTRSDQDDLSPEEIGRASSYDDQTEVQRRIDRGAEDDNKSGHERADDADTAGGPPSGEIPERREDQDEAAPSQQATRASDDPRLNDEPRANHDARANDEASAPPLIADPAAMGPAIAELIATRAELRRVETERKELRDALARRQADFENYRKRVERDRTDSYHRMVGDVVSKLLPVLDNLRRALDAEGTLQASESEEFRHFLHGVELIYRQLGGVLEGLGLQPIAALGERFDPHVHEAVVTEQSAEHEPDTVIQELVPGYRLGEKLLRPAIVKVATR